MNLFHLWFLDNNNEGYVQEKVCDTKTINQETKKVCQNQEVS